MKLLKNLIKGIAEGIVGQILTIAFLAGYIVGVMKAVDIVDGRLSIVATGILFTASYLALGAMIVYFIGEILDRRQKTCRAESE